jgi:hypothetical protein
MKMYKDDNILYNIVEKNYRILDELQTTSSNTASPLSFFVGMTKDNTYVIINVLKSMIDIEESRNKKKIVIRRENFNMFEPIAQYLPYGFNKDNSKDKEDKRIVFVDKIIARNYDENFIEKYKSDLSISSSSTSASSASSASASASSASASASASASVSSASNKIKGGYGIDTENYSQREINSRSHFKSSIKNKNNKNKFSSSSVLRTPPVANVKSLKKSKQKLENYTRNEKDYKNKKEKEIEEYRKLWELTLNRYKSIF